MKTNWIAKSTKAMVMAGALGGLLAGSAWAGPFSERTVVTFNTPVEIPGQVLPAGTYVFRLNQADEARKTVEIMNGRENHVIATLQTASDYTDFTPDHSVITLDERTGSPIQALNSWFYPGDSAGHQFLY